MGDGARIGTKPKLESIGLVPAWDRRRRYHCPITHSVQGGGTAQRRWPGIPQHSACSQPRKATASPARFKCHSFLTLTQLIVNVSLLCDSRIYCGPFSTRSIGMSFATLWLTRVHFFSTRVGTSVHTESPDPLPPDHAPNSARINGLIPSRPVNRQQSLLLSLSIRIVISKKGQHACSSGVISASAAYVAASHGNSKS
jgi:hypothetical protein